MSNGLSLKSLAADLLNISLDKSLELRCSDWEADELTMEQVKILFFFFLIFSKVRGKKKNLLHKCVILVTSDDLRRQRRPSFRRSFLPSPGFPA